MVLRRSRRYLSCFYCGKRSNLPFQGQQSFVCAHCDATNWLDKNGGITDPPGAIDRSEPALPVPTRYAIPRGFTPLRSPSPPPQPEESSMDSIFCETCLKNQKMFVDRASEFELLDDPNDPEYAVRLKGFRRWRRNFEQDHPHICADCEPKVQEQLQKASYTAKTDHLRRMMDRTKAHRVEVRKREMLDYVDIAGRLGWNMAFILQFIWHISIICTILMEEVGQGNTEYRMLVLLQRICQTAVHAVPPSDRFILWAINMSMISSPWNPKFKQTIRGFTTHILGLRQWYTYQLLAMLIRFASLFIAQFNDTKGLPPMTQLSAHVVITFLVSYVYQVAQKAIRTDTTPLFGSSRPLRQSHSSPRVSEPRGNSNDLGTILDDILTLPSENVIDSPPPSPPRAATFRHADTTNRRPRTQQFDPYSSFGSLNLSNSFTQSQTTQDVSYDDEMDWAPSGSQHRAFANPNTFKVNNPRSRFNDAPAEPKSGPFWYKVPPAPTNPARRLRNPPMQPVIRESPKEKKEMFFQPSAKRSFDMGTKPQESSIIFQDPKFFAPEPVDDPRDGLSRMMGSFSISPDPDDARYRTTAWGGGRLSNRDGSADDILLSNTKTRAAELVLLIGALWAWVTALATFEAYGPTLAMGAICACLFVSIRLAADLLVEAQIMQGQQPSVFSMSWANLGLAQVVAALILMWQLWTDTSGDITCGAYGNALFGIVIIHQVWQAFG